MSLKSILLMRIFPWYSTVRPIRLKSPRFVASRHHSHCASKRHNFSSKAENYSPNGFPFFCCFLGKSSTSQGFPNSTSCNAISFCPRAICCLTLLYISTRSEYLLPGILNYSITTSLMENEEGLAPLPPDAYLK